MRESDVQNWPTGLKPISLIVRASMKLFMLQFFEVGALLVKQDVQFVTSQLKRVSRLSAFGISHV